MNNLVNSDPAHSLLPPPKGIKFLETAYASKSCVFHPALTDVDSVGILHLILFHCGITCIPSISKG